MSSLVVPIRVDALCLYEPLRVVGPSIDYPHLPWSDGERYHNTQTPNLARYVHNEPFADHALDLSPGMHLHWALPDGLTKGATKPRAGVDEPVGELFFPAAPDRWLVMRRYGEHSQPDATWLVESDYLHPFDDNRSNSDQYAVPYPNPDSRPQSPRYRRMGRQVSTADGSVDRGNAQYLNDFGVRLTALGEGDPAFASLYANCRTIFGAYDAVEAEGAELSYDVFGWYSNQGSDPLYAISAELDRADDTTLASRLNRVKGSSIVGADQLSDTQRNQARLLLLEDAFGWTMDSPDQIPDSLLCWGRVVVDTNNPSLELPVDTLAAPVAIGNSAPEAMATLIADAAIAGEQPLKRAQTERTLEALRLGKRVQHHAVDVGAKFNESRHSDQFQSAARKTVWVFRPTLEKKSSPQNPINNNLGSPAAVQATTESAADIPESLLHRLDSLNQRQQRYEAGVAEIASHQQRVFNDWFHLMSALYHRSVSEEFPVDVNLLRVALEQSLDELESLQRKVGELVYTGTQLSLNTVEPGSDPISFAALVMSELDALSAEIQRLPGQDRELAPVPGPRFYVPNEPVLAINHPLVRPNLRHGHDGHDHEQKLLRTVPLDIELEQRDGQMLPVEVALHLLDIVKEILPESIGMNRQPCSAWNPLLIEWQAQFEAYAGSGHKDPATGGYRQDAITKEFRLANGSADLHGQSELSAHHDYIDGRALLNATPLYLLQQRLKEYLADTIEEDNHLQESTPRPLLDAIQRLLASDELAPVAFPLGGFNSALLAHRTEPQIAIADPIGFTAEQRLASRVSEALAGMHPDSPEFAGAFNPLRAGEIRLDRLRIIDTFGRSVEWSPSKLMAAETLQQNGATTVGLPPRFVQPMQLSLRWLSAKDGDVESNAHPASTPVCGWLIPNHFDHEMAVYSATGKLLGEVDVYGNWRLAPGTDGGVKTPSQIEHPRLRRLVEWMTTQQHDGAFVPALSRLIDTTVGSINPADTADSVAHAFLMGRPIAIVGASMSLQMLGLPARSQAWHDLQLRLHGAAANEHDITRVQVPVRVGDHALHSDGTVGYWVDSDKALQDIKLVSPLSAAGEHTHSAFQMSDDSGQNQALYVAAADDPIELTILMDPRGVVHASCGVLPTRSIDLPSEFYIDALAGMRTTFLTAPILTPPERLCLSLPDEPGYSWSWLARTGRVWTETPSEAWILRESFAKQFVTEPGSTQNRADTLWLLLIKAGWLSDVTAQRARLTLPPPGRLPLEGETENSTLGIVRALQSIATGIERASLYPRFDNKPVVTEGWLQLRPSNKTQTTEDDTDITPS